MRLSLIFSIIFFHFSHFPIFVCFFASSPPSIDSSTHSPLLFTHSLTHSLTRPLTTLHRRTHYSFTCSAHGRPPSPTQPLTHVPFCSAAPASAWREEATPVSMTCITHRYTHSLTHSLYPLLYLSLPLSHPHSLTHSLMHY